MLSVTRLPQMCRRLLTLKKGLGQVTITHLPACVRIQTCVYSSSTGITAQNLIDDINEACKFKDRKGLLTVLKTNNVTKLQKPLVLSAEMEVFLKPFLFESPMGEIGITALKFLLKHGERDSDLERSVLKKVLKEIDGYNALGCAAIIGCVQHVNTDLRWTLVTEYEKQLKKGLYNEGQTSLLQSFGKYSGTALFPYLLQAAYRKTFQNSRTGYTSSPRDIANALMVIGQQNETHYCLFKKIHNQLAKITYVRFRFSIDDIQRLLFLCVKFQSHNYTYLKMLSKHLKTSLDVMIHSDVKSDFETYSNLVSCLISYAILGYHDEEILNCLAMKIRDIENPLINMKCYSAFSMLNHPGLDFSKEKMKDILANEQVKEKMNYTWLRALVDEQILERDYVKDKLIDLETTLTEMIRNNKLTYQAVSSYFLLKAYSEIDLGTPIDVSVDETALRTKLLTVGTQSSLKETLKCVLTEMFGDDRLLRGSYFNEYGHLIDIEFHLDNDGKIHNPETYDGNLTRFIVLGLNETDLIMSPEKDDVTIQIRHPQLTKIRQLEKLENTKVIPVYWMEWNELKDRHNRKKFLQSEIDAILEGKKELSSV